MIVTSWLGFITRTSIALTGLWYFFSIPSEQIFSARILQLFGLDKTHSLLRYFSIIDFGLALSLGILVSHAIFWPCIARKKTLWPRWGDPALRALDYFWYAGAAVGLVFVAVQAQGRMATELRESHEGDFERHNKSLRSDLIEVPVHCAVDLLPPKTEASEDYRTAYTILQLVCDELSEAGSDGRRIRVARRVVLSRCDQVYVDYWPPEEGQHFSEDLRDYQPLLDAYRTIIGVCYSDHHVSRINEKIDEIKPFENATKFSNENPLLSGYITWFALLLAFRLSRTTAEVVEAIRNSEPR